MDKFIINGGRKLKGATQVSGSKNVALKTLVAACLTDEQVIIDNIPLISDLFIMADIIRELGGRVEAKNHCVKIQAKDMKNTKIALERAVEVRTSAMFMAPLLARKGEAIIPNPGGCRIGARPIDRTIDGLSEMGVNVIYKSSDGYFYMSAPDGLHGADYTFKKSTHTGTETLILAGVLAKGKTILRNSAQEPEIDELIELLKRMGARIKKTADRTIEIEGVKKLSGAKYSVGPDRNEVVTLGIAAIITKGDVTVKGVDSKDLKSFIEKMREIGAGVEETPSGIRFFYKGELSAADIETGTYPSFMTDWQAPFAVLMTQAKGESIIHERVYESRFGYVSQLQKMGANIKLFNPEVENPQEFYNFNIEDDNSDNKHAARIKGAVRLHNAVVTISDLRAGATLVLAALAARGESAILEVYHLDRGYEKFEDRLNSLGAQILRENDE
ncbi:MAG: UDP-N-acetylglucosamine 1-carboxyvinyltransferase [Candidatus Levybacteria bacterium]|nr:UDP-N-acetylglucosamine 1-carboxyvinyltransferase [Candidatus Levybacteria bacterium]